mmetsp:Transcript_54387/g.170928  ORF Transcript_54387/g.170928 Transcript_54387/m.170928 type:complete len:287 (-) Transcript_54387:517-1377(-)
MLGLYSSLSSPAGLASALGKVICAWPCDRKSFIWVSNSGVPQEVSARVLRRGFALCGTWGAVGGLAGMICAACSSFAWLGWLRASWWESLLRGACMLGLRGELGAAEDVGSGLGSMMLTVLRLAVLRTSTVLPSASRNSGVSESARLEGTGRDRRSCSRSQTTLGPAPSELFCLASLPSEVVRLTSLLSEIVRLTSQPSQELNHLGSLAEEVSPSQDLVCERLGAESLRWEGLDMAWKSHATVCRWGKSPSSSGGRDGSPRRARNPERLLEDEAPPSELLERRIVA